MRANDDGQFDNLAMHTLRGVEMGPLDRPKVYKDESEVYYVDHLSADDLKKKYPGEASFNPDNLMPIDFIADGRPLKEIIGDKFPLDYVIASHVIEHVPDLVGWLKDAEDALRPGGVLVLWNPDKRFTFDLYRKLTQRREVAEAHAERRTRPGLRLIMDHFAYCVNSECWALWDDYNLARDVSYCNPAELLSTAAKNYEQGLYVDVHNWVFTPWSFLELIGWITEEFGLTYNLRHYESTPYRDLSFRVQLEKSPTGVSTTDWAAVAQEARETALWPESGRQIANELGLAM